MVKKLFIILSVISIISGLVGLIIYLAIKSHSKGPGHGPGLGVMMMS